MQAQITIMYIAIAIAIGSTSITPFRTIATLTGIVDNYSPTPDSYSIANVVTGNAVVLHSLPAGILSLSDVRYDKIAFSIHHGSWELLILSEPGVVHSGRGSINGTR